MNRQLLSFCFGFICFNAMAQNMAWPEKSVRVIVPFAAGGAGDVVARIITPRLSEHFGQTFIVENKLGAGGTIGAELMARSKADGYTLMIGASSYAANAALYKLPYDPIKGVSAVILITRGPFILAVHPSVLPKNLKEFISYLHQHPDELSFGSSGTGGVPHLAVELFKQISKTRMVHIPYKGDSQAISDMLGGHIQVYFGGPLVLSQHIRSGKLKALAVSTEQRSKISPELPSISESVPGYSATTWMGMWAPFGTPKEIILQLNQSVSKILNNPEVDDNFRESGMFSSKNSPEEFNLFISQEIAKYQQVVQMGNIRID